MTDNIEDIDRVMISAILAERGMVIDALAVWGERQRTLSSEKKLAYWQTELDVNECMLLKLLIQAGVTRYCEYATMTGSEFEAAVTNRDDRATVNAVMAGKGLRRGVEFSEEMWRTLRNRPQDITANEAMLAIVDMTVESFVNAHNGEFDEMTRRFLAPYYDLTVFWYMGRDSAGMIVTADSFRRALAKHGLWLDFTQTEVERRFFEARKKA